MHADTLRMYPEASSIITKPRHESFRRAEHWTAVAAGVGAEQDKGAEQGQGKAKGQSLAALQ